MKNDEIFTFDDNLISLMGKYLLISYILRYIIGLNLVIAGGWTA